ncbi:SUKH-4 family immunity protein [Streptomyces sp. NPDC058287]|uniref:SUKH-4 family immunity protein n=1 Tax=unclassified Streptomyces TaxID=2593676 RepID=UPI0036E6917A
MLFDLTNDDLVRVFGADRVTYTPAASAEAAGISGTTLAFMTEVGLPENEFISFPDFDDPGTTIRKLSLEELGATWNLPDAALEWVFFGNFEISVIVLDTRTGEIHQLTEGIMSPIPLHTDVSSLIETITRLSTVTKSLPEDYAGDEDFLERLEATLDTVKSEITELDLNPFHDDLSEWVDIVTTIGAGSWAADPS